MSLDPNSDAGPAAPASADVPASARVPRAIARLARAIGQDLSPGDVAALRRMDPADPSVPAFWKVAMTHLRAEGFLNESGLDLEEAERNWAGIVAWMAQVGRLHQPGSRLGRALAAADFSELRFVRLLRASGRPLLDEVRLVGRFLTSKAVAADGADIARLILSDRREHGEQVRRHVARDYYATIGQ